jgi:hypothetical protein
VELGRRSLFRGHPTGLGHRPWGDATGGVHQGCRIHWQGAPSGTAERKPRQVPHRLPVTEQRLDFPPPGLPCPGVCGRQARRLQPIGPQGAARAPWAPPDPPPVLRGVVPRAGAGPPRVPPPALRQGRLPPVPPPLPALPRVPPTDPGQAPSGPGGAERADAIPPIAHDQRALGDLRQRRAGPRQFPRSGIRIDGQVAGAPPGQIVKGGQAPGQPRGPHVGPYFQPMGHGVHARAIDDPALGTARAQRGQGRGLAGGRLRDDLRANGLLPGGEKSPRHAVAALDAGLWRGLDGGPALRQGGAGPVPLPFRRPGLLQDRPTQTGGQMVMQHLDRPQPLDGGCLGLQAGHTMSSLQRVLWPSTPVLSIAQSHRDSELT